MAQGNGDGSGRGDGAGGGRLGAVVHPDFSAPSVDKVMLEERAAALGKRSLRKQAKVAALKLAVSMIDLTALHGRDSPGSVRQMCQKAREPHENPEIPSCAAVSVDAKLVSVAKQALEGSSVKVASVSTAYGADEIAMVIDRGAMLSGDFTAVFDEIAAAKEACGRAHLNVILETGELCSYDVVRKASRIAMLAGSDFLQTSMGKLTPAATPAATLVVLEAIRDFYYATGRRIGMKPGGGICTAEHALHALVMVKETLGDAWLTSELLRFSAGPLLNDVLMQIEKD